MVASNNNIGFHDTKNFDTHGRDKSVPSTNQQSLVTNIKCGSFNPDMMYHAKPCIFSDSIDLGTTLHNRNIERLDYSKSIFGDKIVSSDKDSKLQNNCKLDDGLQKAGSSPRLQSKETTHFSTKQEKFESTNEIGSNLAIQLNNATDKKSNNTSQEISNQLQPVTNESVKHFLEDLWVGLSEKSTNVKYPNINDKSDIPRALEKMFSSSNVTVDEFKSILTSLKNQYPWISLILESACLNMTSKNTGDRDGNALLSKRRFMISIGIKKILFKIIDHGFDLEAAKSKLHESHLSRTPNRKLTHDTNSEPNMKPDNDARLNHDYDPINEEWDPLASVMKNERSIRFSNESNNSSKQRKDSSLPEASSVQNKGWPNNRMSKGSGRPFTEIQGVMADGSGIFTGKLLNSVPDEVLLANGWTNEQINSLPLRTTPKNMSRIAREELGLHGYGPDFKSRVYDLGTWGECKFAKILLSDFGEETWCLAKKIKITNSNQEKEIHNSIDIQKISTVGSKIHGISKTVDKNGDHQLVIFFELPKGRNADSYLKENKDSLNPNEKIEMTYKVLEQVDLMHRTNIIHANLQWRNIEFDQNSLRIRLMDFRKGSLKKHRSLIDMPNLGQRSDKAPEIAFAQRNSEGFINFEKCDIYSTGVMLANLFGKKSFQDFKWSEAVNDVQRKIDESLEGCQIEDPKMKEIISKMVQANPEDRPSIAEVMMVVNPLRCTQDNSISPREKFKQEQSSVATSCPSSNKIPTDSHLKEEPLLQATPDERLYFAMNYDEESPVLQSISKITSETTPYDDFYPTVNPNSTEAPILQTTSEGRVFFTTNISESPC